MFVQDFSPKELERGRNLWWTVYILDRKFSSLMGNPPSIQDSDITVQLPSSSNFDQKPFSLAIHVELSQLIAQVINSKTSLELHYLNLSDRPYPQVCTL